MLKHFHARGLLVATVCLVGGWNVGVSVVRADDTNAMQRRVAVKPEQIAKVKEMMHDPAMAPAITATMTKMHAMEEMAAELAKDPECKAMCEKMMADKTMTTATPEANEMAKDDIMKDPEAMKMVAAKAMMMNSMHMAEPSMKMDDGMKHMEGGMKPMEGGMKPAEGDGMMKK